MKQFKTILKFEIANYFKSKVFIGFTICLVIIIGVLMFFPRITAQSNNSADSSKSTDNLPVMYILSEDGSNSEITKAFQEAFSDYEIKIAADEKEILDQINSGNAEWLEIARPATNAPVISATPKSSVIYLKFLMESDMDIRIW